MLQKRSTFEVHVKKHITGETTCKECFKEFDDFNRLKVHLWNNHKKDPQLECTVCHKFFNRKLHLAKHLESHQRKEIKQALKVKGLSTSIQCVQCPRYFKNKKTLELHVQKSHEDIPNFVYICDFCSRTFNRKLGLIRHIRVHASDKVNLLVKGEAMMQDFGAKNEKTLQLIENSLTAIFVKNTKETENFVLTEIKEEPNPLMCSEDEIEIKQEMEDDDLKTIPATVSTIVDIKREIFHDFENFAMNDSSLGSVEDASFLKPLVKIEPEILFKAVVTQDSNVQSSATLKNSETEEIKNFPCDTCEKSFNNDESLRQHHKKEHMQLFQCDSCDKSFEFFSRLQRHIKSVHQPKVREHKCELCRKAFPNLDLMNRHVRRIHKKMLDHKCNICEKGFHTRMELERHSLKSIECSSNMELCETCNSAFTDLRKLEIHKTNEHSLKKEAFCSLCEFRGSRMELKEHSQQMHNLESKYDCEGIFDYDIKI